MDRVNPNRLRLGACAWLLTLQFFVVEAIVALRLPGYSRVTDTISALGSLVSPAHRLMNASFALQGLLILAGALLLRPALRGRGARVAPVLLAASAVGVVLVSIFPMDGYTVLHATGAVLHLLGGGLGLIALAYGVRPRSEALGTTVVVLGLIATAMTVFFLLGVTDFLGLGATERAAAYPIPIALALTGGLLLRIEKRASSGEGPAETSARTSARQLARREERELKAQRKAERDAALEAAAERAEAARATAAQDDAARDGASPGGPAQDGASEDAAPDEESDLDPEDPWATPGRRRRD